MQKKHPPKTFAYIFAPKAADFGSDLSSILHAEGQDGEVCCVKKSINPHSLMKLCEWSLQEGERKNRLREAEILIHLSLI